MLLPIFASVALAFETDGIVGDLTYEGTLSETSSNYKVGAPVSIKHSGGNISVRCMEVEKLAARLPFTLTGSNEGSMEATGKGIGLLVGGDSKGGTVSTRIPSRGSGVATMDVPLTVNIPLSASAVSVSQSGSGWVQVTGCSGKLTVSAGAGGAFASGSYTSVTMSASGADVKLVQESNTTLTGNSTISAPGGTARVQLATSQGGKLSAKAAEVSVGPTVMGTVSASYVAGELGLSGPSISVSAKDRVEVTQ